MVRNKDDTKMVIGMDIEMDSSVNDTLNIFKTYCL